MNHKVVISVPLMNSEPWLLCSQPLPNPSHEDYLSILGETNKEVGLLGNIPHSWGNQALTHTLTFPSGRNRKGSFLALSHLVREVMQAK